MSETRLDPVYDIARRRGNSRGFRAAAAIMCLAAVAAACTPQRDYRGFIPQEETLSQVRIGMGRSQIEELLGTPSASSNFPTPRYYYISSTFETTAFFDPQEVDRKVYAVEFDETDRVSRLAHYGLRDGKVFDFISRTTPTRGKELNLVQELLGNVGRFGIPSEKSSSPIPKI